MSEQREQWEQMLLENAVWDSVVESRPGLTSNILDAMEQAVEAEREACAKVLDDFAASIMSPKRVPQGDQHGAYMLQAGADKIRARGKA